MHLSNQIFSISVTSFLTNPHFTLLLWQNPGSNLPFLSQHLLQTHILRCSCDRILAQHSFFCHKPPCKPTFHVTLVTESWLKSIISVTTSPANPHFPLPLWQDSGPERLFLSQHLLQTHVFRSPCDRISLILACFCHKPPCKPTFHVTLVTESWLKSLFSVTASPANPLFSLPLWQDFGSTWLFLSQDSSQTHISRYSCDRIPN